ncbi:amino acid adenylation domain-containing protein, partial [Streptomyces sp. NPDC059398]|uniref:amino acid adenylation domain-containing protein n=1 Tax=Streptomyces sp. NPDC059398 TaxID=3346820 RepID=UPI00369B4443
MTGFQLQDVLPLTPLQQGMLFHALYDSTAVDVYTAQFVFDIEGPVNAALLRAAVQGLLRRHANLRVGFLHEGLDEPVQAVAADVAPDFDELDFSAGDEGQPAERLAEFLAADRTRRFDLSQPPLLRFTLIRMGHEQHRLVMTNHHILLDGWSMPLLVRELFELYARGGDDSAMPRVAPYRNYLAWLASQDRTAAAGSWRNALAGVTEPTLLSGAGAAPAATGELPGQVVMDLGAATTARLRETARRHRLTLNTLVQGAWGVLLHHLTGQDDVLFGTTVSGRPPEIGGVESMVGLFINTIPVRIGVRRDDTLAALLNRAQQEQTRLLGCQHIGLTEIGALTGLDELFDTLAVFENYPMDAAALRRAQEGLPGLRITGFHGTDAAHYPLTLTVAPGEDLRITFGYRTTVFGRPAVEVMAERLRLLLEAFSTDLELRVGELPVLLEGERERLLGQGRGGDLPVGVSGASLPELFAERVKAAPDAVAVSSSNGTLTYGELDHTSAELAACLAGHGVRAEDGVGVLLTRAPSIVTASLAAVRASAMYVPLDHQWPTERLHQTAHTARLRALIVDHETATHPWVQHMRTTVAVLVVDALGHVTDGAPATPAPLPTVIGGAQLAYMMFTSGSTGTPKGVGITHRDITALTADTTWANTPHTILMHSAYVFDASTFEIWTPLLTGGRIAIAPPGPLEPHTLHHLITTQNVTALFLTTALFNTLADTTPQLLGTLRLVATGGETATPGLLQQLATTHPQTTFHHVYGPTETTTFATRCAVSADGFGAEVPPIGCAMDGMRAYVLDTGLRPVPPHVTGELYLAGPGVARGYVGQPALTATRFVVDPFSVTGDRMYRTGDLVRWNHNDELEYVSRADTQIKLRGYRIEPTEIETALRSHPSVATALVTLREDAPGDRRLVAYVTPTTTGAKADSAELSALLGRTLPPYMVPSAFITLDTLPLTLNGKIDHTALPAPETAATPHGREPATAREEILCGLFADILNRDHITIDDNFFTLGGHSLLATRLTSRIRTTLNAEIEIRTLFEHPTVATLTHALDTAHHARPTLTPHKRPDHLPLSHAQQRLWFLNRYEGPSPTYNIPLVLRLDGPLDTHALRAALADLVERHETLRTVYPETDGVARQLILDTSAIDVAPGVQEVDPAELDTVLGAAVSHCFDVSTEVPIRTSLLRLGAEAHVLVLVVHHIAADGWSLTPLADDLGHAYRARTRSTSPDWTPLPVQYADYTLWQHHTLGEGGDPDSLAARQLAYWRKQLDKLPELLQLPTDHPRPALTHHQGNSLTFHISPHTHHQLTLLTKTTNTSTFMTLQAALATLLSHHGAGDDIPLGTAVAGRTDEALDHLIGFFINTLVLRTDLSGDPTFRELLHRTRTTNLTAYTHQDLPFERLVDALCPSRAQNRHPLFQTMLVLQNQGTAALELPGITTTALPVHTGISKFDLTFTFVEKHDENGRADGIEGSLEYSTELFEPATARALADRFCMVLGSVVADPDQRVRDVDFIGAEEASQLVAAAEGPTRQVERLTVPEAFQAQAARTPDAVAARDGRRVLTYAQLDAEANDLCHHLVDRGVGPEDLVALALPGTVRTVVSMLAVLKAGAAYLPVDPEYPASRITYMLEDARPALLILTDETRGQLPPTTLPAVSLDDKAAWASGRPAGPGAPGVPGHPADGIY